MPVYVTLFKYTDQALRLAKNFKKYQEEAAKRVEKTGTKILGFYMTMGEYDAAGITECPSDEAAVAASLAASLDGTFKTTTLRAFTADEFEEIIRRLP